MRFSKERTPASGHSHHEMRRTSQSLSCTPSPPYPSLQIHQFSSQKPTPSHPEEEFQRVGAQQNHPVTPLITPSVFSARVIECIQHLRMEASDMYFTCIHPPEDQKQKKTSTVVHHTHNSVLARKSGRVWLAPHRLVSSTNKKHTWFEVINILQGFAFVPACSPVRQHTCS